jgi:hypothetical protein
MLCVSFVNIMAWNVSSCSFDIVFGICLIGGSGGVGVRDMIAFCEILTPKGPRVF